MPQNASQPPVRPDGLQLQERREYQENFWRLERWAWAGFLLLTVAAALGVTGGGGPLSRNVVETAGGKLDYPAIGRWQTPDRFVVHFPAGPTDRSLTFDPRFAQSFQIDDVRPRPVAVEGGRQGETLHFRLAGGGPAEITLHVTPLRPGRIHYRAILGTDEPSDMTTILLP